MLIRTVALLVLLAVGGSNAATIAFERDGMICVAQPDGSKVRKVTKGVYPDISADGTMVVFNTEEANSGNRKIALADVATGKVMVIPNIPSDNCFGPAWSPDGTRVAFQMFNGTSWEIALIGADGADFEVLTIRSPKAVEAWRPTWAADGKSIFCHDLEAVFQVSLDGRILHRWPLMLIGKDVGMSSGSGLAASPDGRYLLMDVDMATEISVKGWDGPPPALWKLDLRSEKFSLVSPMDLLAWSPCWVTDDVVLCQGATGAKPKPGLYQLSLKSGGYKLLIPGATNPSASAR